MTEQQIFSIRVPSIIADDYRGRNVYASCWDQRKVEVEAATLDSMIDDADHRATIRFGAGRYMWRAYRVHGDVMRRMREKRARHNAAVAAIVAKGRVTQPMKQALRAIGENGGSVAIPQCMLSEKILSAITCSGFAGTDGTTVWITTLGLVELHVGGWRSERDDKLFCFRA
ncbi:MAG: hypothetical protein EOS72_06115 [Mesorhizobium sp.]|uniref:hypothetical protein n=1 Tax=Mesorhizobium sp. TaxID=1871066 RepID=UPI000FE51C60|nr:hypothetical protein [Mesorhizobium sp.]RWC91146.1 MAG: hypothetical protein EOS72_06115 [Mesorhizobium sp.]